MRLPHWVRPSLLATFCIFSLSGSVTAAALTTEQRTQIEGVIRDYLVNNPRVLKEALISLQEHQATEQQAAHAETIRGLVSQEETKGGMVLGNPKGDVTFVAFSDYNCSFCKKALVGIEGLIKADPGVRFIVLDFPILRPESVEAALVHIAAGKQLSPAEQLRFHSALLHSNEIVDKKRAFAIAKSAGMDLKRLEEDMASAEVRHILAHNAQLAEQLSITGTPSFAVGDSILPGALSVQALQEITASVRQCGKAKC